MKGLRRCIAAGAVLLAACGGGSDTEVSVGPLTTAALQDAADRTQGTAHRFEGFVTLSGPAGRADEVPLLSGEVDGARAYQRVDMQGMFDAVVSATGQNVPLPLEGDLTMESVVDGTMVYVRMPFLASIAEQAGIGPLQPLADLGDGWGRIDLTAFGDLVPAEVLGSVGGSGFDPSVFLRAVEAAGQLEDLGQQEILGTAVRGVSADVDLQALLDAQGIDPSAFGGVPGAPLAPAGALPIEVWVDDDGLVRRIAADIQAGTGVGMGMVIRIDFFDYGDGDIDIDVPDGAVDVTEAFRSLLPAG